MQAVLAGPDTRCTSAQNVRLTLTLVTTTNLQYRCTRTDDDRFMTQLAVKWHTGVVTFVINPNLVWWFC